jgi:hypothetical protein
MPRSATLPKEVVYEDVKSAVVFDGCLDDAPRLGGLGDVAMHGDGLATGCGDGGDNCVRASRWC